MNRTAALSHLLIALAIGGVIGYFTPAKWVAASCWVSAALFLTGSLAFYEDARPGGFDNPDGAQTPAFATGAGARSYWARSLAISVGLVVAGALTQWWLSA